MNEDATGSAAGYRAAIERWENEGGRPLTVAEIEGGALGGEEGGKDDDPGRDERGECAMYPAVSGAVSDASTSKAITSQLRSRTLRPLHSPPMRGRVPCVAFDPT